MERPDQDINHYVRSRHIVSIIFISLIFPCTAGRNGEFDSIRDMRCPARGLQTKGGITINTTETRVSNIDTSNVEHIPLRNIVNLLAHPVQIRVNDARFVEIPPSGKYLRLIMTETKSAFVEDIPIYRESYIHSCTLPEPDDVHYYIVPRKIAALYPERMDLIYPYAAARETSRDGTVEYDAFKFPDRLVR